MHCSGVVCSPCVLGLVVDCAEFSVCAGVHAAVAGAVAGALVSDVVCAVGAVVDGVVDVAVADVIVANLCIVI